MAATRSREQVVSSTTRWVKWWIEERKGKLREHLSSTMSINPFMLPILFDFHSLENFDELSELFIVSHLMVGHSTGFGKLIDEKILPNVFGTTKLTAAFRRFKPPFEESRFDEIDHVVARGRDKPDLLSLKASKWTIQLTMAVQLNKAFSEIVEAHGGEFGKIMVGVFYGKKAGLTDKYDILRGINRGRKHDVIDLTKRVDVVAGREFWSWINGGEDRTHEWVLEGVLGAIRDENLRDDCRALMQEFNKRIRAKYLKFVDKNGRTDWVGLLREING